jgi:hypothetical protein
MGNKITDFPWPPRDSGVPEPPKSYDAGKDSGSAKPGIPPAKDSYGVDKADSADRQRETDRRPKGMPDLSEKNFRR